MIKGVRNLNLELDLKLKSENIQFKSAIKDDWFKIENKMLMVASQLRLPSMKGSPGGRCRCR